MFICPQSKFKAVLEIFIEQLEIFIPKTTPHPFRFYAL